MEACNSALNSTGSNSALNSISDKTKGVHVYAESHLRHSHYVGIMLICAVSPYETAAFIHDVSESW